MMRKRRVTKMRTWREMVRCGDVETVYSTVVGEGRRVRRCGWTVNIALLTLSCSGYFLLLCCIVAES